MKSWHQALELLILLPSRAAAHPCIKMDDLLVLCAPAVDYMVGTYTSPNGNQVKGFHLGLISEDTEG